MSPRHHSVADESDSGAGWLVVLSAFIAGFVVFGVMYSFGVFFTPMEAEFGRTQSSIETFDWRLSKPTRKRSVAPSRLKMLSR